MIFTKTTLIILNSFQDSNSIAIKKKLFKEKTLKIRLIISNLKVLAAMMPERLSKNKTNFF